MEAQWNATTASGTVSVVNAVCGDLDGSGEMSLLDAVRLLRSVAGLDAAPNC